MVETYEYFIVLFFLLLSAFYSGSEAMLLSVGVDRLMQLAEEDGTNSAILKFTASKTNEILMSTLVGNNFANVVIASYTNSIIARLFDVNIWPSVLISSFLVLFFGDIMPKIFSRNLSEKLLKFLLPILKYNYYFLYPILYFINKLIKFFLGRNAKLRGNVVTEEDILYMVNKAEKDKSMDSKQIELLNSILEFPTIKVKDIMIPRNRIKAIDISSSFDEILKFIEEDNHSRYPVYQEELDNMKGFLHVKTLLLSTSEVFKINDHIRRPVYVYEHMKIQAVFDHMNRKKVHLALVRDENNLITGLITLEDIMEEIFGDIQDEHDSSKVIETRQVAEGFLVKGTIPLRDLYNEYDVRIPLNDNYSTLNGMMLDILGDRFPEKGQMIVWEDYIFELADVKDNVIIDIIIREREKIEE